MKKNINSNSGITIAALIITIIVMMIIAAISVYEGRELIAKSRIQTLEANMLKIQAKAKAYAEEIDAKIWTINNSNDKENKRKEEFSSKGLTRIGETDTYTVTNDGLVKMGLNDLKNEVYTVIYSNEYKSIDVQYSEGVSYKGNTYTKLSELEHVLSQY